MEKGREENKGTTQLYDMFYKMLLGTNNRVVKIFRSAESLR